MIYDVDSAASVGLQRGFGGDIKISVTSYCEISLKWVIDLGVVMEFFSEAEFGLLKMRLYGRVSLASCKWRFAHEKI
ncbi:hypothetical protein [Burkholderia cepacia]|uniref:hypothetical protein n=1 Tax=Burkholderia cepacia TaxID=292 RepID=UPI0012D9E9C4|nr:hypothetical protein [Burkholderia cepacia]